MNRLTVNIKKTKIMIFHRGRLPNCDLQFIFRYKDLPIERVNSFVYLGFTFSQQLSFTLHIEKMVAKARSRIAVLSRQVNLKMLNLEVTLKLFYVYIFPIFRYGLPIWLSSQSQSVLNSVNALFTKYLKTYLGLPMHTNNSIVHYLTETSPLVNQLRSLAPSFSNGLSFPSCLQGLQLNILRDVTEPPPYNPIPSMPTTFWGSKMYQTLPSNYRMRRLLCRDIVDMIHFEICVNKKFHISPESSCLCQLCGQVAHSYHHYNCS